jgi:cobalt-zinc-cadmium efflux system protein
MMSFAAIAAVVPFSPAAAQEVAPAPAHSGASTADASAQPASPTPPAADNQKSIVVAGVILWGSIGLLKEALGMSLMGVPAGIEVGEVKVALARLEGVETVHDLHVWPLSTTETALTAHLVAPGVESTDALLTAARRMLHDRFAIEHCTLQVERIHLEDTEC